MPVPVVVEFVAGTAGLMAGIGRARTEMAALTTESTSGAGMVAAAGVAASAVLVAGAALVAGKAVEMAGDFQSAIVHLTTDAGEAKSNMQMISDGILSIARETGSGTKDLINAMYYIESAGQHGTVALDSLNAAAEGAKVGSADLTTVANALMTVMTNYGPAAGTAAQATDGMIYAVSQGRTKLEDFAGALSTLLPAAHTAGLSVGEMEAALSTMTYVGQDAASGATHLRQTILQLSNPTAKAKNEMESLGLSAIDVAGNLGQRGLSGTFDLLTGAIKDNMGPAGTVLIDTLKSAAKDTTKFQQVLANLSPEQQTYIGALADMTGGTKSLQAVLQLTGDGAQKFKDTTAGVAEAVKNTSSHVADWDIIQGTFNQKMTELRSVVETAMISIGQKLLPVVSAMADKFLQFTSWLGEHTEVLKVLGIVLGVTLAAALLVAGSALVSFMAPFVLAMLPIMAVIGAIALLAGGLVYLYNNVRPVHDAIEALRGTFKVFTDAFNADPSAPFWDRIKSGVEAFWPVFKAAMVQLGTALWTWIEDNKQPALNKLSEWGGEVMAWLTGTGLPWLARTLTRLGIELWSWIEPQIPGALFALAEFVGGIAAWIGQDAVPWLARASVRIGFAIVQGIIQGLGDAAGGLFSALGGMVQNALGSALSGISGSISGGIGSVISGHAIPGFATGVTNFEGGMALVGENGPELVNLPRGSDVHTNAASMAMAGGGGGGGSNDVHVYFAAPVYGGPSGMQEVAAIIRTELLKTKARNGGLGLA